GSDEKAALVVPLQQLLLGQQRQGRPHRRARDVKGLGHEPLRHVIAGLQVLLLQPDEDALGQRDLGRGPARRGSATTRRNPGTGGGSRWHDCIIEPDYTFLALDVFSTTKIQSRQSRAEPSADRKGLFQGAGGFSWQER